MANRSRFSFELLETRNALRRRWASPYLFVLVVALTPCAALGATFVVDSTGDESDADLSDGLCRTTLGTCTLRAAIEQANALPGADLIIFNIPGPGVHTISPASPLPPLTDEDGVTIDGYTQPGASPNTLAVGNEAVLRIELDGTSAGTGTAANGLTVQGRSAAIRGLVINRFWYAGIAVTNGQGHQISGCFVGTDPTGSSSLGNRFGVVIDFSSGSSRHNPVPLAGRPPRLIAAESGSSDGRVATVGGTLPEDRNIISGNTSVGIYALSVPPGAIENSYIGTDASGEVALPNQATGIALSLTSWIIGGGDLFGRTRSSLANVISGNWGSGILLSFADGNDISGNLIGTDAQGARSIPNGTGIQLIVCTSDTIASNLASGNSFYAIRLFRSSGVSISRNRVGTDFDGGGALPNARGGVLIVGSSADNFVGPGNLIACNEDFGVGIGADATDPSLQNRIWKNSIHDNRGLGIDLALDGVTPNDDCDLDTGPNLLQNFPVLERATTVGNRTKIRGTLNSTASSTFTLEFFENAVCDPSGFGEGERYLGSAQLATDASCSAVFEVTVPVAATPGSFITATATDAAGNTSEFSACVPVEQR